MNTAEKFKKELETTFETLAVEKRALKACVTKEIRDDGDPTGTEVYTFKDGSILESRFSGRRLTVKSTVGQQQDLFQVGK